MVWIAPNAKGAREGLRERRTLNKRISLPLIIWMLLILRVLAHAWLNWIALNRNSMDPIVLKRKRHKERT